MQHEPADERPRPLVYLTNYEYELYGQTIIPRLLAAAGQPRAWLPFELHRSYLLWLFDHLRQAPESEGGEPTLVFAHILMPHPPFAFEADGSDRETEVTALVNEGKDWYRHAEGTNEDYRDGYADAVKFLNGQILSVVRSVLSRADRPTIFYLQGDHGPGSRLDFENIDAADVRERMGILLAARFPDGGDAAVHPHLTPVNALRILTNCALGSELPLLEDRAYFTSWREPFDYVDVTHRVR